MEEQPRPNTLGERLKEWRDKKELSQRRLASLARVDHAWINRLESGEKVNVSVWIIRRIARVLGVGIDYLVGTFEGDDDPEIGPESVYVLAEVARFPVSTLLVEEGA
jgi:transcriptional regulator with XRE-family HTH domain